MRCFARLAGSFILLRMLGIRGISLFWSRSVTEAMDLSPVPREIFDQVFVVDPKDDDPEQFRAIGWSRSRLCSVIFEIRHDAEGEYYRLVTAWKATNEEEQSDAENI